MQTLQTLEELWTRKPAHRGFVRYAQALHREGRSDHALQVLSEGLQRWPRDLAGQLLQARIAGERGDASLQKSSLENSVGIDPRSPAALFGLGSLLAGHQYFQQAKGWLERYVALYPSHAQGRDLLESVLDSLSAEGSRHPAASVAIPMEESPADLVEGTFSVEAPLAFDPSPVAGADPFAPQIGLGAPDASGFGIRSLGRESANDEMLATLEMASFHDQNSVVSSRSHEDELSLDEALEPAPEAPAVAQALQTAPFGALTGQGLDVEGAVAKPDELAEWDAPTDAGKIVTGVDISSRLEDLFREEPSATVPMMEVVVPPPAGRATGSFNAADLGARVDSLAEELDAEPESGKVTGRDVQDRLDDLFPSSELPETTVAPPPSAVAEPSDLPDMVRGDDVDARLEELFGSDDLMATSAMERPSFPPEDEYEATIQIPTIQAPVEDIEDLVNADEARETGGFEQSILEESTSETQFDPDQDPETARLELGKIPETLADAIALGRETTAESLAIFNEPGSTMDLPALQEPDSWQPGSMLASRGSDVDSQLDELFASSSFPKEQQFPPMSPPVAMPPIPNAAATSFEPKFHSEHAATSGFSRAEVTGEDINDRLDALFGTDSAFPDNSSVGGIAGVPTVTLAEEYLRQGHQDQAEAVYRELVTLEPSNAAYRNRLAQIQAMKNS
jgi:tetratricopeptide (TPR) repeat protein